MTDMNEGFRLYADSMTSYHATFDGAKEAARPFMASKGELRIEILFDINPGEADFWAFNYDNGQWEPS